MINETFEPCFRIRLYHKDIYWRWMRRVCWSLCCQTLRWFINGLGDKDLSALLNVL